MELTSTRRAALKLGALAPLALAADMFDSQAIERFTSLCSKLTGFPEHLLDRQFSAALLQALVGQGIDMTALTESDDSGLAGLAEEVAVEIVSAWYAGTLPTKPEPTVAKFHDALVWQALDFATVPTACTRPGAWAEAPPESEDGNG